MNEACKQKMMAKYEAVELQSKLMPILEEYQLCPTRVYRVKTIFQKSWVHIDWELAGGRELWQETVEHIGIIETEFVGWQLADFIDKARQIKGWNDGQVCMPYPILWKPIR